MSTGISVAEYHRLQADNMTEKQLQAVIIAAAQRRGYLAYHTHDSRRSQPGYPDLHLVHQARGTSLFRELKTTKGRTTTAQNEWLTALAAAGHNAKIWRPIDWFDGTVNRELDEVTS